MISGLLITLRLNVKPARQFYVLARAGVQLKEFMLLYLQVLGRKYLSRAIGSLGESARRPVRE